VMMVRKVTLPLIAAPAPARDTELVVGF
jgi:hypothetical protein